MDRGPTWPHTHTHLTSLIFLILCFAVLRFKVVLHLHVDRSLNICDFFPKLSKLSFCHESERQFVLFLVICQ